MGDFRRRPAVSLKCRDEASIVGHPVGEGECAVRGEPLCDEGSESDDGKVARVDHPAGGVAVRSNGSVQVVLRSFSNRAINWRVSDAEGTRFAAGPVSSVRAGFMLAGVVVNGCPI